MWKKGSNEAALMLSVKKIYELCECANGHKKQSIIFKLNWKKISLQLQDSRY